jgi:SAM-dependent methyltransferase
VISLAEKDFKSIEFLYSDTQGKKREILYLSDKDFMRYKQHASNHRHENLHIGCGNNHIDHFLNVDKLAGVKGDVICDVDICEKAPHLPFRDNSFYKVYSSMLLEHITNLLPLAEEIWRVLKPGGVMEAIIPWWSSFRTWGDPTHVRAFNSQSFQFWCGDAYDKGKAKGDSMGQYRPNCNFKFVLSALVLPDEFAKMAEDKLSHFIKHHINVVSLYWVMLKAIKPTAMEEGATP